MVNQIKRVMKELSIEDKKLLLIDLSARLPYSPLCYCKWSKKAPNGTSGCIQELSTFLIDEIEIFDKPEYECQICEVKPYLRPISSMTEKEKKVYKEISHHLCDIIPAKHLIDWLNAHHFDYRITDDGRTMIEAGLALPAPEGMYKIE